MRERKEIEEQLKEQDPGTNLVEVSAENQLRATFAILNTSLVQAELLLDIRDLLTNDKKV